MPDRRHQRAHLIESSVSIEPGTLGFYAQQYLRSLEVRNYSPQTVRGRRKDLLYFMEWAADRATTRPEEVSVPVLERYQRYMFYRQDEKGRRLTFRVQNSRMIALRMFFRWLVRQRVIEMSPAELLELPRKEYRLPKPILTVAEVESIMGTCDIKHPIGLRDRAMMELLYSSGLRRFEVCNLKVWHVLPNERTVVVSQGKGKRDRVVPLGERAALWIQKYLDEARPQLAMEPDCGHLFLTIFRVALVPERVSDIVRAAARAAGIERSVSAHIFRHTMATMMLDGGADIRYVQAMLGHAQLSTTEIYTRVAIKKLREVHAMSHPHAQLAAVVDAAAIDEQLDELIAKETLLTSLAAEAAEEERNP